MKKIVSNYIPNDGYTEEAYIKESLHEHTEFRFKYRPMLVEQRINLVSGAANMKPDAYERKAAAVIANDHLTEWSLVDAKGNPVKISPSAVLRLKMPLWQKIYEIVCNYRASDTDPNWDDDTKDEAADHQYESALTGKPLDQVKEEAAEKN